MTSQPGIWSTLIASALLAAALALSHGLLRAAALLDPGAPMFAHAWRIGAALVLYGLIFAVYTYLLRWFELSLIYPLYTGLSVVLVFLTGVYFFAETMTPQRAGGMALIVLGVALISGSQR
jgi:small multidrug resistance pump